MLLALGCDHAAIEMKNKIFEHLKKRGIEIEVFAPDGSGAASDYPVYAERAAQSIRDGHCDGGILICGTGAGMCIAANKVPTIRAVVCSEAYTARMAKEHNNANVICVGARVVGVEVAIMIADAWLDAEFQGGRHAERVALFDKIENSNRG